MPEPETIDVPALARAYASGDIDLICVLGPTASGKTRYAVQLAKSLSEALAPAGARPYPGFCGSKNIEGEKAAGDNRGQSPLKAEILSGDSRQIYRSMDIGTGKDLCEYGDVPYHLIDIVPAGSKFNIYQYQAAFAKAYADVRSRGCIPILCGGSGLYIEAVTRAYKFEKENGLPAEQLPSKVYYIGTLVSREERVARIDRRLEERLQEGLVEEIRGLLETVPAQDLIYYGLEYKFVTQYVLGELSYEDMQIALGNAIHQFAKRQMTWFRGMERDGIKIHWVRP
ncbi:MAG: tRNA (adenosine(37)-N6)-dimethylallyltransferase MiaA [Bacteroidales bacterium]|nr:tRNA (adenosine(37)-N6)-dimethylallyltransferase MiaA [Bacteroidales bacterium]